MSLYYKLYIYTRWDRTWGLGRTLRERQKERESSGIFGGPRLPLVLPVFVFVFFFGASRITRSSHKTDDRAKKQKFFPKISCIYIYVYISFYLYVPKYI